MNDINLYGTLVRVLPRNRTSRMGGETEVDFPELTHLTVGIGTFEVYRAGPGVGRWLPALQGVAGGWVRAARFQLSKI